MSNARLKVKTFGHGSAWGYRVVNGVGQTLVCRRGFPKETFARIAGRAAADALAPLPNPLRYAPDGPQTPAPSFTAPKLRTPKQSLWQSLFG
jgi:hypothetical protein